jgi:hypothetical protein
MDWKYFNPAANMLSLIDFHIMWRYISAHEFWKQSSIAILYWQLIIGAGT